MPLSTASCTAVSRMTPRPLSTAAFPASNWGLTSAIKVPPTRRSGQTAGSTERREMNERSITMVSKSLRGRSRAVRWRALIFSKFVTRGSARSLGWSCARPTSTQITSAAPAWRAQSVKPPVDAPTSRTCAPRRSSAKRSRAPQSFSPPRETKRGGCSTMRSRSVGNSLPGLSRRSVPRRTRPLIISAFA